MKKYYFRYSIFLLFLLYINTFCNDFNKEKYRKLNNTEKTYEKLSNSNKKSLIYLIIKTICICLSIIIIYIIFNNIIKRACLKKEVYDYLNKIYDKKNYIDEQCLTYIVNNLNIHYFFHYIKTKLIIICKFKYKSLYSKYNTGCSICLGEFQPTTKIIITSCEHIFHYDCMKKYLKLIEKEMNEKKGEENLPNFLNYFNCPNCKKNILQKKKQNIIEEKFNIEEIKLNKRISNNIFDSVKLKEKSSSELSLSSSVSLKSKSVKTKKLYPKKVKLIKKKNFQIKIGKDNNILTQNSNIQAKDINIENKTKEEE